MNLEIRKSSFGTFSSLLYLSEYGTCLLSTFVESEVIQEQQSRLGEDGYNGDKLKTICYLEGYVKREKNGVATFQK